ncbi:MAG: FAD-dependent oxidoreductase [Clostridiaceae bacterium]|nr:FAD-dependent oxidoreductase [Clostridiaceae bacterium]
MSYVYTVNIDKQYDYDVIVCGGGCAGFVAAIASARQGAKTVLLEKSQIIGGTLTAGLVGPFMTSFDGAGSRQIVKGIFDEFITRLEAENGAVHPSKTGDGSPYACYYKGNLKRHNNVAPVDSSKAQLVMIDMLKEAGVDFLINMDIIDVIMEENKITGVIVHDGSKLRIYRSKVTIDCTGDGLVSYKAGAICNDSKDGSSNLQPMTTFFEIYNVDDAKVEDYAMSHPEESGMLYKSYIEKAMKETDYPIPRDKIGIYKKPGIDGEWKMNCTRMQGMNSLLPEDLTKAYEVGLRQIFFLMDFIRTLPGLENARLKEIASAIGIRETRRLDGVYTLQMEDLMDPPRKFDDSIAMGSFCFDLHPSKGTRAGIEERPHPANCFQIPYRIMVPVKVDGLLVAGRCVSASRDALSSIRVMPQAFALGEAGGVAAALCVKDNVEPRDVDIDKLRKTLVEQGAIIE